MLFMFSVLELIRFLYLIKSFVFVLLSTEHNDITKMPPAAMLSYVY